MSAAVPGRTYLTLAAALLTFAAADYGAFRALNEVRREAQDNRGRIAREFAGLRVNTLAAGDAQSVEIADLRRLLDETRDTAVRDAAAVKEEAQQQAVRRASGLARAGGLARQRVRAEIGDAQLMTLSMKLALEDLHATVSQAGAQTSVARSGVRQTARDIDAAAAELAGLGSSVESHQRDLAALKQAGDRDYIEFALSRAAPQTVLAGIEVSLRRTDAHRRRFTLDVVVNGHRYEHKDRTLNEPLLFYAAGARQPYELVATEVGRDRISGYLAAPKPVQIARN